MSEMSYDDAASYASQYCFTDDMEALVHNIVIETKLNELDEYESIEEEFERRVLDGVYYCVRMDLTYEDPCDYIHFEMRPEFCSLKKLYVVYAISLGFCIASKLCDYREDFSLEPIIDIAAKESGEPQLVRERIPEMLVVARKQIEKAYKEYDPNKIIDRSKLMARKNHNEAYVADGDYHYDEDYYEKKQEQLYNDGYDEDNDFYSDIC